MRPRDVTIPLALWICAAICAHFLFGTGGLVVAKMHEDRSELWKLSREASDLAKQGEETLEVSLDDTSDRSDRPPPISSPSPSPHSEDALKDEPKPKRDKVAEPRRPKDKPKARKEPPSKPPPKKKDVVLVQKEAPQKPPVLPDNPLEDRRIAVRQHAKPDQADDPNAHFIADQANHVDKETVATQTSHDRDDENPTPAGNHPGAEPQPGDAQKTRIAESEEHKGEKNRAPGERGTDFNVTEEPKVPRASATSAASQPATPPSTDRSVAHDDRPQPASLPPAPARAQTGEPPSSVPEQSRGTLPSPDVVSAGGDSWTFNPTSPGGSASPAPRPPTGVADPTVAGGRLWTLPGLGQQGPAGAFNTNIDPRQMAFIVGADKLRKLREADGERRASEHRGSWAASSFERWRSAIENYVSSVKPGNQTALNTARVPFASYLNAMHNRIHPIFADSFLESLDGLPASHPLNDRHLVTRLEIVLTKEGHLKRMGVVKTSGITAFDIAALDAVDRAQPFGPAPAAIVSPDGNVYLHWEFHRDEVYACSTMGAHPFLLNVPAGTKPEEPAVPPAPVEPSSPGHERGAPPPSPNDSREGRLLPLLRGAPTAAQRGA